MNDFYTKIMTAIPDFSVDKCRWILHFDIWETANDRCCRLIICFDDRIDLSCVGTGVREITIGNREKTPGNIPYTPYDLGEFFIQKLSPDGCYLLADELKGWRIVADSWVLERIADHDASGESTAEAT